MTAEFNLFIPDWDRSANGLGWEHARRGKPLDSNPYPAESWKHEHFSAGWKAFQRSTKTVGCGK